MGIITKLKTDYIKLKIKEYYNLNANYIYPTKNGISNNTYLIKTDNKNYILKIYEYSSSKKVNNEIDLLKLLKLKKLNVPHVIGYNGKELIHLDNKPSVLFSYMEGRTIDKPNKNNIKQIALFLVKLHSINYNKKIDNIYTTKRIEYYLRESGYNSMLKHIDSLNLIAKANVLIHGDLFMDNVRFNKNGLRVFDFSDFCHGDLYFDIAVIGINWCFLDGSLNKNLLDKLINTYNSKSSMVISLDVLLEWMRFACLYYGSQRIYMKKVKKQTNLSQNDIEEYIKKFHSISSLNYFTCL